MGPTPTQFFNKKGVGGVGGGGFNYAQYPIPRGYVLLFFMLLEHIVRWKFYGYPLVYMSVCLFVVYLSSCLLVCLFVYHSVFLWQCEKEPNFFRKTCFNNFEKKESSKLTTVEVFDVSVKNLINTFCFERKGMEFLRFSGNSYSKTVIQNVFLVQDSLISNTFLTNGWIIMKFSM